jgi:ATP-binding cassette, subfamily B, bacterial PglK
MNYLKTLLGILNKTEKNKLIIIYALIVLATFLEFLSISSLLPLIGVITDPQYQEKIIGTLQNDYLVKIFTTNFFHKIFAIVLIVYFIKFLFLVFLSWYRANYNEKLTVRIKNDLFKIYLNQEYIFFLKNHSSKIIRNLTNETNLFVGVLNFLVVIILEISVLVALLVIVYLFQPVESVLVIIGIIIFGLLVYFPFRNILKKWGDIRQINDGKSLKNIQQGLGAIKDLKINKKEQMFLSNFNLTSSMSAKAGKIRNFLFDFPRLWLELIIVVSLFVILFFLMKANYDLNQIIPSIALYAAIAFRALPSINRLIVAYQSLTFSKVVVDVLKKEFDLKTKEDDSPVNKKLNFNKSLVLKNIKFNFDKTEILRDINLEIKKKEVVGIVGSSGSGKTTLINLIAGLLKPHSGQILIDGESSSLNNNQWKENIGYMSQHTYIFDDTITRNITLDKSIDNEDKIREVLKLSCLDEIFNNSELSIDSDLGEYGSKLSIGQIQRIGIARAIYKEPQILILDEATSALDDKTEKQLIENLIPHCQKKGITIILISHRSAPLDYCNKIYNLED